MIIVISSQKPQHDSPVDPRFGRAQYFVTLDTDSQKWDSYPNPAVRQSGGAGVAAAQFVIDKKVDVVLSGDFGPNASRALSGANIQMGLFSPEVDTVQSAVDLFNQGKLKQFA